MFRKNTALTPLETRKRILLLESELNRNQLLGDLQDATVGLHAQVERFRSLRKAASSAAVWVASMTAFRASPSLHPGHKSSWLQSILLAARVSVTLWAAMKSVKLSRSK